MHDPSPASNDTRGTARLFLALWPDAPVREALAALADAEALPGRPVAAENLHITLSFLGRVAPEQQDCVRQAAAAQAWTAFVLVLDRLGHWPRPRVCWAGASRVPEPLLNLQAGLATALAGCGFEPDHRPYSPHVTLARKCPSRPSRALHRSLRRPVVWRVDTLALVASETDPAGARYRVLERWQASA